MAELLITFLFSILWLALALAGLVAVTAFISSRRTGASFTDTATGLIADTWARWVR